MQRGQFQVQYQSLEEARAHLEYLIRNTYWFFQTAGQVHNRDIRGWHTESHSSKFPVRDMSQQGTASGSHLPA